MSARILVVEDDTDMSQGLKDNLEFEGYEVDLAEDGETGIQLAQKHMPDCILLDVMLPDLDGFEVCRRLRENGFNKPIIMLTARSQEIDKVRGLELGADDYVTKPFSLRELLARLKAAIRRSQVAPTPHQLFEIGNVTIDLTGMRIVRGDKELPLGHYEGRILEMLVSQPGVPVGRDEILGEIWGLKAYPTNRTVDNHVVSLRRKIEEDPTQPRHILTIHGIGYKYAP